eukprot:6208763-Pleurochrysis_carterae.AAC.4
MRDTLRNTLRGALRGTLRGTLSGTLSGTLRGTLRGVARGRVWTQVSMVNYTKEGVAFLNTIDCFPLRDSQGA